MANRSKNISNELAYRIKALRLQHNLTQKELAEQLYKSESTVRMWELGKSEPDLETLNRISKVFHTSVDFLLGGSAPMSLRKGVKIPVYGSVAAGIPIEAITDIEDYEEITDDLASTGEFAALKIHGDSMEPRMTDGDVVIVRIQDSIDSGDIAIIMVNGDEATCKKVMKTADGIMLMSTNPKYEPMFYTNKQISELPIRIFGKVVELRAKLG